MENLEIQNIITPTLPSPVEGEGISSCISIYLPSPLAGEGRVRGPPRNFFTPSPVEGEGKTGVKWRIIMRNPVHDAN